MNDLLTRMTTALVEGQDAAWALVKNKTEDLGALEAHAEALGMLQQGLSRRTLYAGWIRLNLRNIDVARQLTERLRDKSATAGFLHTAAWYVYRLTADPRALHGLNEVLPWFIVPESWGNEGRPSPEKINHLLTQALAFFERRGNVASFIPLPEDLKALHRLCTISGSEGHERRTLSSLLLRRMPRNEIHPNIPRLVLPS